MCSERFGRRIRCDRPISEKAYDRRRSDENAIAKGKTNWAVWPRKVSSFTPSVKFVFQIRGSLVLLPLFFLKNEALRPEGLTKENVAPTALWT